ncbi:MAG: hypothetical protein ACP5M7_10530, partial [Thermoproteota archaeon]
VYLKNEYNYLEKRGELNSPAYPHLEIAWLHAQSILDYLFGRYKTILIQNHIKKDDPIFEKRKEILEYLFANNILIPPKVAEYLTFKGISYVKENIEEISKKFGFGNDNLKQEEVKV